MKAADLDRIGPDGGATPFANNFIMVLKRDGTGTDTGERAMYRTFIECCLLIAVAASLSAQDSPAGQQVSAARLEDWLGSWVSETGGFECEPLGQAAVVCRSHWLTENGDVGQGLYINRWDGDNEVFRTDRFYDTGQSGSGFTWVEGHTWTSVMEGPLGSRDKVVWTLRQQAAEYTLYRSVRGGPWESVYTTSYRRAEGKG